MALLFDKRTSNGPSTARAWRGGIGTFAVWGSFGGGTLKLQMSPDGGVTWIDLGPEAHFTATGVAQFGLGVCLIRAELSGSDGNASVSCSI